MRRRPARHPATLRPRRSSTALAAGALAAVLLAACAPTAAPPEAPPTTETGTQEPAPDPTELAPGGGEPLANPPGERLRDLAPERLVIGSAVAGGGHHRSADYPEPFPNDETYLRVLGEEFSSVTHENQLKFESVQPRQGEYDFGPADAVVDFAEEHGQLVRGHTLLWHSQNPDWVEDGDFTPEELREILRDHIQTVVGRYAGRIAHWEVANEIIDDQSASLRRSSNIWIRELGPGIIADAFRWAHEADPDALLFLNDYAVEAIGPKSDAYYELAQELLADGVPIHGFGVQGHLALQYSFPNSLQANLQRFADLGLVVAITEIDVRMGHLPGEIPSDGNLAIQADYYSRALEACLAVEACVSFTTWGFPDSYSWIPTVFAGEGAATVLFDDFSPKPAYHALSETLAAAS